MARLDETITAGQAGHISDSQILARKANYIYDVMDYGATGDGVTDDTAAIQATIDAATGAGVPASVARWMNGAVYLPPGDYKVTAPLTLVSVTGFRFEGAGQELTFLIPEGTFDTVLDLDGIAQSSIGGFTVKSVKTHDLDSVIKLEWTTAAARSTTQVEFYDIYVRNLTVRAGFAIGENSGNRQVSEVTFYRCIVSGTWLSGELTDWQKGFSLGSGTDANILNLNMIECRANAWARGVDWNATNGAWFGGSVGGNGTDFYLTGAASVTSINQVRSESSKKFLDGPGASGADGTLSISNVDFHCNALDSPYSFIEYGLSGKLSLFNVFASSDFGKTPKIEIQNSAELAVTLIGSASRTPVESFIFDNASGKWSAILLGYWDTDANTVTSFFQDGEATAMETGFFGATPVGQQTGVTVDAAGIHAALVNLGLITA